MSYFGSKGASGAYQAIIAMMPPHQTYIETHLGGGAVMLKKPPVSKNVGIDVDHIAIDEFSKNSNRGDIDLICSSSHDFLSQYNFQGDELIYSDPPYLHSTRTSNKRYRFEYSENDHVDLIELLCNVDCNVILSGYPSRLYDDLLLSRPLRNGAVGWNTKEFQSMTRGGVRTEKLWYNYELNSSFWATFAGDNFTDRQRIKRKAHRWATNFKRLPPGERRAIMAALLDVE